MSIAYTLTPAHLEPNGYQKMNVPLAFELFSERVRVAMELFMDDPKCPGLKDAAPTIYLIRVVDNVIRAMMSRKPSNALRPTNTCIQKKAIHEFLNYLDDWQNDARVQGYPFPISASTVSGFKVTLESTLELLQFLHNEFKFDYLMTARLNQDALERFFSMMRNACGSNDHPDPVLFAQVFRLMCSYSLIKPPKGSNVSGTDLLQTLMRTKESLAARQNQKKELFGKLDSVIEGGQFEDSGNNSTAVITERDHHYFETCSNSSRDHLATHDYDVVKTSEEVMAYIAGYIARKGIRLARCLECRSRLKSEDSCDRDRVIDLMNRFGGLLYPSEELFQLTRTLEAAVLDVVGTLTVKENTLHQIVERVGQMERFTLVGCEKHEKELTKDIVTFYLIMRVNFIAKSVNKNYDARKIKTKMNRKKSKL